MRYEIERWQNGQWDRMVGVWYADNPTQAVKCFRHKTQIKGLFRAVELHTVDNNQYLGLDKHKPIPPLDQKPYKHQHQRTRLTPSERYTILNPAPKRKYIIDLSKPSRRDIRFK